jgi:hypothetical protein
VLCCPLLGGSIPLPLSDERVDAAEYDEEIAVSAQRFADTYTVQREGRAGPSLTQSVAESVLRELNNLS